MVNICGKCRHFMRTETDHDGNYYHYCNKADELYGNEPESEPQPDSAEGTHEERPTLKVKFNSEICEYYEKKWNNPNRTSNWYYL